jgi:hypothetical protein
MALDLARVLAVVVDPVRVPGSRAESEELHLGRFEDALGHQIAELRKLIGHHPHLAIRVSRQVTSGSPLTAV